MSSQKALWCINARIKWTEKNFGLRGFNIEELHHEVAGKSGYVKIKASD